MVCYDPLPAIKYSYLVPLLKKKRVTEFAKLHLCSENASDIDHKFELNNY